eukprot:6875947-Prymnesium_polylepis.1
MRLALACRRVHVLTLFITDPVHLSAKIPRTEAGCGQVRERGAAAAAVAAMPPSSPSPPLASAAPAVAPQG